MRILPTRFYWVLLLVTGLRAQAQEPFSISPTITRLTNDAALLRVAFGVPTNHFLYADKLALTLSGESTPAGFNLPEPRILEDKFSGKQKKVFGQSFEATRPLPAVRTENLVLTVHFQGCDDANCFFPEDKSFTVSPDGAIAEVDTELAATPSATPGEWRSLAAGFTVAVQGSGYLREKDFLAFLDKAQSSESSMSEAQPGGGASGILLMICLIVLGGVALNLTPCILPMIPINIAIIGAGAQAGSKKRGFALGATYAAGMAIAYGLLGLLVVLTGSKFGTLNSSPWFNLGIALVFGVLALGMFDVLAIDLSRFQSSSGDNAGSAKSKFVVAYTMGTVAALLAGACVAPVVISVLLQATTFYNSGITAGLLLPFLLGLGMGLPWPFAGAGLSFLPKPGRWMTRVKYGFGAFIILFAAYYGHLSFSLFQSSATLVASATAHPTDINAAVPPGEQLAQALRQAQVDGQPLFIDFWASWCKNCSAMEHTTFESAPVKQRLAGFRQVRLQTERPNQAPSKEVLDHFKVMGLPSYVILKPKNVSPSSADKHSVTASIAR
jgi:thiol:disulfide interchange protein